MTPRAEPATNQHLKGEFMIGLFLAQHRFGRVLLHLAVLVRSGALLWHWDGICREFRSSYRAPTRRQGSRWAL